MQYSTIAFYLFIFKFLPFEPDRLFFFAYLGKESVIMNVIENYCEFMSYYILIID